MRPRTKASLLWGIVGTMSFLVLVQGYELVGDPGTGFGVKLGVALLVGAATTLLAYAIEGRLGGTDVGEADSR
ncbi:hypothetical protein BRC68_01590 [Halobacteriales archaeon QH_6_64_20]|nr:MAG: hypothetical protein BRC68_01590 [Halobacteriales archaeon QH_6_64_20]